MGREQITILATVESIIEAKKLLDELEVLKENYSLCVSITITQSPGF